MKKYWRVMLGKGSVHIPECLAGNFIGVDYGIHQDLTGKFPEEWRLFNKEFIPIYLSIYPEKTRVAAGLACGTLWTISKGLQREDMVISPDGEGHYHVCELTGDYYYQPGGILPHRRSVKWFKQTIARSDMTESLRKSAGAAANHVNLSIYQEEIDRLVGISGPTIISTDETVEDPLAFAMEKHLEDFLVQNWAHTELSSDYMIYQVDGETVGQQFDTDTGPIDILAISKDKKTLLVVELKKGRASDVVVGQVLRYMGYVKEVLAEPEQSVKGVIIAMQDDVKIQHALAVVPNIDFYRYQVSFKLLKKS